MTQTTATPQDQTPDQTPQDQTSQDQDQLTITQIVNAILADMEYKVITEERSIWTHRTSIYQDLYLTVHGDMLPDDHRYEMIHNIILTLSDYLTENPDMEDLSDIDDKVELLDPLVPIHTSDLTSWLESTNSRYTYVDDAIDNYGKGDSVIDDIAMGYYIELEEIFYSLIEWITDYYLDQ